MRKFLASWAVEVLVVMVAGIILLLIGLPDAHATEITAEMREQMIDAEEWVWTREFIVEQVTVTVGRVSDEHMRKLHKQTIGPIRKNAFVAGIAILHFPSEGSTIWTCHIFLAEWANEDDFQHELRHCQGWIHQ